MRGLGILLSVILVQSAPVLAKDLGRVGTTFMIEEPCLLTTIQSRLQRFQKEGKVAALQKAFQGRVRHSLERPRPVASLRKAEGYTRRFYDPSLILTEDLKDMRGRLFGRKGEKINPLDHLSFGADMLFFNADDPDQLAWALREPISSKWVLVKGAPLSLQKQLQRPVYFDQGGILSKKFGLKAVPTRLRQAGRRLLIEEIDVSETENEGAAVERPSTEDATRSRLNNKEVS